MKKWRLIVGAVALVAMVASVTAVVFAGTAEKKMDIMETLAKTDNMKTLVKAIEAAGMAETLKGEGPYTLFAPTDDAWEKLGEEKLSNLLDPENERSKERLTNMLKFHVASGRMTAAEIEKMEKVDTLQGKPLEIGVKEGKLMVGEATVTKKDVDCANGVIQVIDTVGDPGDM